MVGPSAFGRPNPTPHLPAATQQRLGLDPTSLPMGHVPLKSQPRPIFKSSSFGFSMLPGLSRKTMGIDGAVQAVGSSGVVVRGESQVSMGIIVGVVV